MTVAEIGYLDADGYLFLNDRRCDMIVSGGVSVYPAEVEKALLEIAGMTDCAVFGITDDEFYESVCACVVPAARGDASEARIQALLAERLARYKLPRRIVFVDEFPREDSGKVFKRKLRAPC